MSDLILCIESSSSACSVAISKDGVLLGVEEENASFSHAEHLHIFIKKLLAKYSIAFSELSAVAVSTGPGSYTGLRIGVSAAKGICFVKEIPLVSVSSLEGFARHIIQQGKFETTDIFCPIIDARRMEVYFALYSQNGKEIQAAKNSIVDESFAEQFSKYKTIYFFGDGSEKCKAILSVLPNAKFIGNVCTSAKGMIEVANEKYVNKKVESLSEFEPNYIKPVHFSSSSK